MGALSSGEVRALKVLHAALAYFFLSFLVPHCFSSCFPAIWNAFHTSSFSVVISVTWNSTHCCERSSSSQHLPPPSPLKQHLGSPVWMTIASVALPLCVPFYSTHACIPSRKWNIVFKSTPETVFPKDHFLSARIQRMLQDSQRQLGKTDWGCLHPCTQLHPFTQSIIFLL